MLQFFDAKVMKFNSEVFFLEVVSQRRAKITEAKSEELIRNEKDKWGKKSRKSCYFGFVSYDQIGTNVVIVYSFNFFPVQHYHEAYL